MLDNGKVGPEEDKEKYSISGRGKNFCGGAEV